MVQDCAFDPFRNCEILKMMAEDALLEMQFNSDPRRLREVRQRIREITARLGCDRRTTDELVLAVNEACMNIMQHAYKGDTEGEITLRVTERGAELEFLLEDFAQPVDPATIRPRDLGDVRPNGLGTHFIRTIMDRCDYGARSGCNGNFVRMIRKIR